MHCIIHKSINTQTTNLHLEVQKRLELGLTGAKVIIFHHNGAFSTDSFHLTTVGDRNRLYALFTNDIDEE